MVVCWLGIWHGSDIENMTWQEKHMSSSDWFLEFWCGSLKIWIKDWLVEGFLYIFILAKMAKNKEIMLKLVVEKGYLNIWVSKGT